MKRYWILTLGFVVFTTGCTTGSLERLTESQNRSTVNYRYTSVLNCLATVAEDPDALPSFCLLSGGSTKVQDAGTVNSSTLLSGVFGSFLSETLMLSTSRSPNESWTLSPVADYSQIDGLWCACVWQIYGPERARSHYPGILNSAERDPSPGPHFGVADRLSQIPPGWLCMGKLTDVPLCARYKGHCGNTWVWVTSEGMEGLSEFTLVLLDISTLNLGPSSQSPPVLVSLFSEPVCYSPNDASKGLESPPWTTLLDNIVRTDDVETKFPGDENKDMRDRTVKAKKDIVRGLIEKGIRAGETYESNEAFWNAIMKILLSLSSQKYVVTDGNYLKDDYSKLSEPLKKEILNKARTVIQVDFPLVAAVKPDPGIRAEIETQIKATACNKKEVQISHDQWIAYTLPYHATRTNVKPTGGGSPAPSLIPLDRLSPTGPPTPITGSLIGVPLAPFIPDRRGPQ